MFKILIVAGLLSCLLSSCRKSDYSLDGDFVVIRDPGIGIGNRTLEAGVDYLIDGIVFVNDGQELIIEAGAVIRFKSGQAENASALVVARGGRIIAEGTSEKPIVFTAEADDLKGSVPVYAQGLWGGIIILGNATINNPGGEAIIEGLPLSEPRAVYGGQFDQDDSGVLKYVSIRHGGTNIGQGNEINGLTLGGVGSKTRIEFVEVVSNKDDGVECFGGTVNIRNLLVAFCGDDAFDYDLGYRGNVQFFCAVQSPAGGDRMLEADGNSLEKQVVFPYSAPNFLNVTLIGYRNGQGDQIVTFNTNAAGTIRNSVFINQDNGILLEYSAFRDNSYNQWIEGRVAISNNLFFNVNDNTGDGIFKVHGINGEPTSVEDDLFGYYFSDALNQIVDPGFVISENFFQVNPSAPEVFTDLYTASDDWFVQVPYKGAFFQEHWADWSLLGKRGILRIY
jgi:hypothetical protein